MLVWRMNGIAIEAKPHEDCFDKFYALNFDNLEAGLDMKILVGI